MAHVHIILHHQARQDVATRVLSGGVRVFAYQEGQNSCENHKNPHRHPDPCIPYARYMKSSSLLLMYLSSSSLWSSSVLLLSPFSTQWAQFLQISHLGTSKLLLVRLRRLKLDFLSDKIIANSYFLRSWRNLYGCLGQCARKRRCGIEATLSRPSQLSRCSNRRYAIGFSVKICTSQAVSVTSVLFPFQAD